MFAKCTHIMVSLLKAWEVTMVGIECNSAAFLTSFQEGPHQKLFFQGFFSKFCKQDGKLYYSRYCKFSYVITGKLLATHF